MSRFASPLQDHPSTGAAIPPAVAPEPGVHIAPNRMMIDDRFPSLSFIIQTGGLPYFEVLLTIDRLLFDPAQDSRRSLSAFYSSRQDSGLIDASQGQDTYLVPQAVLQAFANHQPKPARIYYTAIAYADEHGNAPRFAHLPQTLPQAAPSVELSAHFTGATNARLLGMSLANLQTIGPDGRPVKPLPPIKVGGLPLQPANGHRNGSVGQVDGNGTHGTQQVGNGGAMSGTPAPGLPNNTGHNGNGFRNGHTNGNGDIANVTQPGNGSGDQTAKASPAPAPKAPPPAETAPDDFQYDDGFGPLADAATPRRTTLDPAAIGGYGDDDFGIPPGTDTVSDADRAAGPNGNGISNGNGSQQATGNSNGNRVENSRRSAENGGGQQANNSALPGLDDISGVQAQSLHGLGSRALMDQPSPVEGQTTDGNGAVRADDSAVEPRPADGNGNGQQHVADNVTGNGATDRPVPAGLPDERKRHIIERVGLHRQPAARYDALSLDGAFRGRFGKDHPYYQRAHDGLSYGIAQFNQDSGQLGILLRTMQQRDSTRFAQEFGPNADALVQMTLAAGPNSLQSPSGRSARVQALDGKDLWEEPWASRFRTAAQVTAFQGAQNQIAAGLFLDPMINLARWFGIHSERGLALLYDRAISQQPNSATIFLSAALSDLNTDALRNQALEVIKSRDGSIKNLGDFQASIPDLEPSEQWDSYTVAALHGALRQFGADSPIALKAYAESLTAIGQAAAAQPFAGQMQRILSDDQLGDELLS